MSGRYRRYRVTVELLDVDTNAFEQDARLGVYMLDQNRIAGDVWLNKATSRHSFDVTSNEFTVSVGFFNDVRHVQELIALDRSRK